MSCLVKSKHDTRGLYFLKGKKKMIFEETTLGNYVICGTFIATKGEENSEWRVSKITINGGTVILTFDSKYLEYQDAAKKMEILNLREQERSPF